MAAELDRKGLLTLACDLEDCSPYASAVFGQGPGRAVKLMHRAATAIRAYLDASGTGAGEARALEWSANWSVTKAETPIGHYFITTRRDGGFDCRLEEYWITWASSEEAAKAAAQADYERRILSALSAPVPETPDWRDDPSTDERWNAGLDFGMTQLCVAIGADPKEVTWDAATETLDGDVRSVIWNILRQKFGEDFPAPVPETVGVDFADTLNFYISDCEDGTCRVPRLKLLEIQDVLRALPVPAEGKPVAWRAFGPGFTKLFVQKDFADAFAASNPDIVTVQPLYSTPAPQGGMREALRPGIDLRADEWLGELIYRALYEHEGGKWEAVETRWVWYNAGARLRAALTKEGT